MAKFDMKGYARRGAEARITELNAELEAIYGAFPDLQRGSSQRGRRPDGKVVVHHEEQLTHGTRNAPAAKLIKIEETGAAAPVRRRRRQMTTAQRKAVGERMRKYWAARRAAAGAKKR